MSGIFRVGRRMRNVGRCCVMAAIAGGVIFVGAIVGSDLPQAWRAWKYSRAVKVQDSAGGSDANRELAKIQLPWDVVQRCAGECADVRLIDGAGQLVPFVLSVEHEAPAPSVYSAKILENSFVAGQYTQAIAELGEAVPAYDRVQIGTGAEDFIVWTELALSDDARVWRVVEPKAPISRFRSKYAVEGSQTIPFEGLAARYLRVRIFQTDGQFPVTAISALKQNVKLAERTEIPAQVKPEKSEDATISRWGVDFGEANLPVSEIAIATTQPDFYRPVRVYSSVDGAEWQAQGGGEIFRYQQGGHLRECLKVEVWGLTPARFLRVEVINQNNQPLQGAEIQLRAAPRTVYFRKQAGASYRLIYGNARATAAQFDLQQTMSSADQASAVLATLAPAEMTANAIDPRPFSERHPLVLWVTLGVVTLLIGVSALRALQTPKSTAP